MKRLVVVALLLAACSPSNPGGYVGEYGGEEAQYAVILESEDCQWLGATAAAMDARYDAERSEVALGYQRAAVDRMVALDCP